MRVGLIKILGCTKSGWTGTPFLGYRAQQSDIGTDTPKSAPIS